MLRQVLWSVRDHNLEVSEKNQEKKNQTNLALKENGNVFRKVYSDLFILILIRGIPNLVQIYLFF